MTALAWDGKVLAADTQYSQCGHKGYSPKLEIITHPIIGKMIIALSGTVRGSLLMARQLETNTIGKVDDYDVCSVYGIGIDSNKKVYDIYGDGCCVVEHRNNPFLTGGSCCDFLYGAMYAGKTAQQAVELAILHRTDAGNECQTLVWSDIFEGGNHEGSDLDIPF